MPGKGPLADASSVVYLYDGSLAGFYCCVYESVYAKEIPLSIQAENEAQPTLFREKVIITEAIKANKVQKSLTEKIAKQAKQLVETVFLSCLEDKEIKLLRFMLLGYKNGPSTLRMLGHEDVSPVLKAEQHLQGERHLLLGFIRFAEYEGVLGATITPKNFILPFIAGHFAARFTNEKFVIFDKTHKAALFYQEKKYKIIPLENIEFPAEDENEKEYQKLWKQFYNTIAIEARYNPKCRMTNMPKRYWENMTEMKDFL